MAEARILSEEHVTPAAIRRVVDTLAAHPEVECVVLFGSQASGTAGGGSDLDLLVIMDTELPRGARERTLRDLFEPRLCALDLIVRTPEAVRYWNGTVGHIITEALKTGTVVYAASTENSYEPMTRRPEELAQEFLKKADNDLFAARHLLEVEGGPTDVPAFHAQQATEKALKALLLLHEMKAPRTHSLPELLRRVQETLPALRRFEKDYEEMSKYGVQVRYPEDTAEPERAAVRRAVDVAEQTVAAVRGQIQSAPDAS